MIIKWITVWHEILPTPVTCFEDDLFRACDVIKHTVDAGNRRRPAKTKIKPEV